MQEPFFFRSCLPEFHSDSFLTFFFFFFCPIQLHGDSLALSEAGGLLPVFRCSVRIIPYVDLFLVYMWE